MMTHTRKLTYIAVLSAISFILMYFQIQLLPTVNFMKLDFSILPMLVGLVVLDLQSSLWILVIRSALQLLLNNAGASSLIGMPMNMIAYAFFILALYYLWVKKPSLKNYCIAVVTGTVSLTLAMLVFNYFYALPLYKIYAGFDVAAMVGSVCNYLVATVLPFNLLQGLIFGLVFYICYQPLKPILKKV